MKILFILGSCENGKDGVADYTIKLANTLISQNIETRILSVNDKFITDKKNQKETLSTGLEIYRLSNSNGWESRCRDAIRYTLDFNPDWLSWQYVPFAFNKKGLPITINRLIFTLRENRKLHIMFHELWIDKAFASSAKYRLLGSIQKRLIRSFIKFLKPNLICTSNYYYQRMLNSINQTCTIQALHSNIESTSSAETQENFLKRYIPVDRRNYYLVGFFGNIHRSTFNEFLLEQQLKEITTRITKKILILSAGNIDKFSKDTFAKIEERFKNTAQILVIGKLSESDVSDYICSLDLALTSYPLELYGKSGAVAAFLKHGKPIVSVGSLRHKSLERKTIYKPTEILEAKDLEITSNTENLIQLLEIH